MEVQFLSIVPQVCLFREVDLLRGRFDCLKFYFILARWSHKLIKNISIQLALDRVGQGCLEQNGLYVFFKRNLHVQWGNNDVNAWRLKLST